MPAAPPLIRRRSLYRYGLFAFLLAVLGAFLLWPIALTVWSGFVGPDGGFTLRYFIGPGVGVLRDPVYQQGLINSLLIAIFTTILCFVISLPMSLLAAHHRFPGKAVVTSLVLLPLILPPFVGAIGLRALLGRFGSINALLTDIGLLAPHEPGIDFLGGRFWGVVVMEALHLYPIMYLNLTAALANIDPALDEAARNLGAGWWRRLWRCTLPLILPGVFAGSTIVFIWSFTELGTPLMFDYYTVTPVQVFFGLSEIADNPRPYALVVVMLLASAGLYLLGRLALGGRGYEMQAKASVAATEKPLGPVAGLGALALFGGVTLLAVLPHAGVVLSSIAEEGAWYRSVLPARLTASHFAEALSHPLAMGSIGNSLLYASIAMVLCIALGLAIAYLTVRVKVKGAWLLDTLGMLPLAVPGLVMAFGYVAMTLAWPMPQLEAALRDAGLTTLASLTQVLGQSPNPLVFLVIAYTIRRLPYILRAAAAGLEQTSGQLEEAALNLGASPLTAIRRVVVPLIMANLIAGGILVFAFAMLEVSDSLILATREEDYPITKAIWVLFNRLGDGPYIASAMGVWGMALLTVTLVGASVLMGKRLGAIFRV